MQFEKLVAFEKRAERVVFLMQSTEEKDEQTLLGLCGCTG